MGGDSVVHRPVHRLVVISGRIRNVGEDDSQEGDGVVEYHDRILCAEIVSDNTIVVIPGSVANHINDVRTVAEVQLLDAVPKAGDPAELGVLRQIQACQLIPETVKPIQIRAILQIKCFDLVCGTAQGDQLIISCAAEHCPDL